MTLYRSFRNPVITKRYATRRRMENSARSGSTDHMTSNTKGMATTDRGALIKFVRTKEETTPESCKI